MKITIHLMIILCSFAVACDQVFLGSEDDIKTKKENLSSPPALNDNIEVSTLTREGIDSAQLYSFVKNVQESKGHKLRSILISRHNKLVLEAYFNGWNRSRKQDLRSATKSFTSALMGIALDKHIVSGVDQPVYSFFNDYDAFKNWDDEKNNITIQDFLRMRTGLACNDWIPDSEGNEEKMYETKDWVKFILDLPVAGPSGENFSYCTGAPVTLGAVIANASGKSIPAFAEENLFAPLGIKDYAWEFMPDGKTDTGGHLHLRPRDMLKFGLLFLNDGIWSNEQLISKAWIQESTDANGNVPTGFDVQYGYLWWCKKWVLPSKTINAFFANGNGGQLIFVLPELDMVVVFTGGAYDTNHMAGILNAMEHTILPAVTD